LDLGEWAYSGGSWRPLYEVVPLNDETAVADEIRRQLDTFRTLVGRDPTHLDSHQHVHSREPVRTLMSDLASQIAVPLRHVTREIRYCGRFYGQSTEGAPLPDAISVHALIAILERLPAGFTELACHPGEGEDTGTMYGSERAQETETLCDPRVRAALCAHRIELCSFSEVDARMRTDAGVACGPTEQLR
jgi:predicted glycoside hydrolase/deacetylase ChbG (UPF0249 family)